MLHPAGWGLVTCAEFHVDPTSGALSESPTWSEAVLAHRAMLHLPGVYPPSHARLACHVKRRSFVHLGFYRRDGQASARGSYARSCTSLGTGSSHTFPSRFRLRVQHQCGVSNPKVTQTGNPPLDLSSDGGSRSFTMVLRNPFTPAERGNRSPGVETHHESRYARECGLTGSKFEP